jgi:hypothetical protein
MAAGGRDAAVFRGLPELAASCPELLERLASTDPSVVVHRVIVDSDEQSQQLRFRGSPTILVDGTDPWATGDPSFGLTCRIYASPAGPAGCPTWDQLVDAVTSVRATRPSDRS